MGLVELMSLSDTANEMMEGKENVVSTGNTYEFTLAGSADEVTPALIKGDLDMACVPANLAAVLYGKTDGAVEVLAVNTLGVLYIVENGDAVQSMADLKGQTIVAAGKGSTPEYALRYLLTENGIDPDKDVTIDWKSEHSECVAALASGQAVDCPAASALCHRGPDQDRGAADGLGSDGGVGQAGQRFRHSSPASSWPGGMWWRPIPARWTASSRITPPAWSGSTPTTRTPPS